VFFCLLEFSFMAGFRLLAAFVLISNGFLDVLIGAVVFMMTGALARLVCRAVRGARSTA
jgi:uncharacterized membrane protein